VLGPMLCSRGSCLNRFVFCRRFPKSPGSLNAQSSRFPRPLYSTLRIRQRTEDSTVRTIEKRAFGPFIGLLTFIFTVDSAPSNPEIGLQGAGKLDPKWTPPTGSSGVWQSPAVQTELNPPILSSLNGPQGRRSITTPTSVLTALCVRGGLSIATSVFHEVSGELSRTPCSKVQVLYPPSWKQASLP